MPFMIEQCEIHQQPSSASNTTPSMIEQYPAPTMDNASDPANASEHNRESPLLQLPTELLDMILDFAYPCTKYRFESKHHWDRRELARQKALERNEVQDLDMHPFPVRWTPDAITINNLMVCKAYFANAAEIFVRKQVRNAFTPRADLAAFAPPPTGIVAEFVREITLHPYNLFWLHALPAVKEVTVSMNDTDFVLPFIQEVEYQLTTHVKSCTRRRSSRRCTPDSGSAHAHCFASLA
jgi:hypothetical protein